jgi:hypothetical protein
MSNLFLYNNVLTIEEIYHLSTSLARTIALRLSTRSHQTHRKTPHAPENTNAQRQAREWSAPTARPPHQNDSVKLLKSQAHHPNPQALLQKNNEESLFSTTTPAVRGNRPETHKTQHHHSDTEIHRQRNSLSTHSQTPILSSTPRHISAHATNPQKQQNAAAHTRKFEW